MQNKDTCTVHTHTAHMSMRTHTHATLHYGIPCGLYITRIAGVGEMGRDAVCPVSSNLSLPSFSTQLIEQGKV